MPIRHALEEVMTELRRLDAAATPAPWFERGADDWHCTGAYFIADEEDKSDEQWGWPKDLKRVLAVTFLENPAFAASARADENTTLIVAARNSVPVMCDALDSAFRRVETLTARLNELAAACDSAVEADERVREAVANARHALASPEAE